MSAENRHVAARRVRACSRIAPPEAGIVGGDATKLWMIRARPTETANAADGANAAQAAPSARMRPGTARCARNERHRGATARTAAGGGLPTPAGTTGAHFRHHPRCGWLGGSLPGLNFADTFAFEPWLERLAVPVCSSAPLGERGSVDARTIGGVGTDQRRLVGPSACERPSPSDRSARHRTGRGRGLAAARSACCSSGPLRPDGDGPPRRRRAAAAAWWRWLPRCRSRFAACRA